MTDHADPFIEKFELQTCKSETLTDLTFAVKDFIDVRHFITGCGNPAWKAAHSPALSHADCVEQLINAGARCLGKTLCDEFAFSLYGKNFFYGTPLNPQAPAHVPGGSSSGSASAVASGRVDFALGTDTAGSVRVPASNCGIFGLRPTHGRCSLAGVVICSPTFDTVGIFSQSLEILSRVAEALLGFKRNTASLKKIALVKEVFELCDKAVLEALDPFLTQMKRTHQVIEISLNEILGEKEALKACVESHSVIKNIEAWKSFGGWLKEHQFPLSPKIKENFDFIASLTPHAMSDKISKRDHLSRKLNAFLGQDTLFCYPTCAGLPPLITASSQELEASGYARRTLSIASIACVGGMPEITVPCATNGIPVGLSFVAGHGQDEFLLQALKLI